MRASLIALVAISLCGCASQGTHGSAPVAAAPAPTSAWSKMPSYFKCDFESHVFSAEAEGGGSFVPKIHRYARTHDPLIYAQIDAKRRTAVAGANATIGRTVSLVISDNTWTFVDTSDPRHVALTTIFINSEANRAIGVHRAVDSRHSIDEGKLTSVQQYGRCEAVFT